MRISSHYIYVTAFLAIITAFTILYSDHLHEEAKNDAEVDTIEALHQVERSVQINPLSVHAYFILASSQQRLGREVEARNALLKAVELQPFNYVTWALLAKYERDLWSQKELAQEHFAIALGLNPYDKEMREEAAKRLYPDI